MAELFEEMEKRARAEDNLCDVIFCLEDPCRVCPNRPMTGPIANCWKERNPGYEEIHQLNWCTFARVSGRLCAPEHDCDDCNEVRIKLKQLVLKQYGLAEN